MIISSSQATLLSVNGEETALYNAFFEMKLNFP